MRLRSVVFFALLMAGTAVPATVVPATGAAQSDGPGDNHTGLPGIVDVTMPDVGPGRFVAALTGGYGYIEPIRATDGDHNRLSGSIGLSLRPFEYFSIWFRSDGRFDMHPDDAEGPDQSLVGDPRVGIRGGFEAVEGLRLGADFGLWLPGAEAPSIDGNSIGFTILALLSYRPVGTGLTLALNTGFRLDQSANSVIDPAGLRTGDQISLGVSQFNAVPLGIGASLRDGILEGVAEVQWDFLLDGPEVTQSPIRLSVGVRVSAIEGLSFELMTRFSLNDRLDPMGGVLTPIEPRFSVHLGARYAIVFGDTGDDPSGDPDLDRDADPDLDTDSAADSGAIRGTVLDPAGEPIAGAEISATDAATWTGSATSDSAGAFTLSDVPFGAIRLETSADGYQSGTARANVTADGPAGVQIELAEVEPLGALRGLVRDFRGRPVSATIRVEPVGIETTTDEEGLFEVELPVGSYEVVISASRLREQRRRVEVEENGVTILNADLRRER